MLYSSQVFDMAGKSKKPFMSLPNSLQDSQCCGHGQAAHRDGCLAETHPQKLCGPRHLSSHWIFITITLNINTVSRDLETNGSQTSFFLMHLTEIRQ